MFIFFQTNNDPSKLRFEEQDIVNETRIRLDKKDVDNILERKHNEMRSANMVKSGYYSGAGIMRPTSAPAPPPPPPPPPPTQQHPPSISFQPQPRQHFPRNFIPMMSPQPHVNMQRHMGGMGAMRRR